MLWTVCVFFYNSAAYAVRFYVILYFVTFVVHEMCTCSCCGKNLFTADTVHSTLTSFVWLQLKGELQLYVETIYGLFYLLFVLLRFAWGMAEAKCILATAVGVSVYWFVPRRIPTLLLGPGCNLGEW